MINLLPGSVEVKYNALNIDGIYVSTIIITNYAENIEIFKTIPNIICDENIEVSFHISRQNNYDILKKLTNIIASTSSELYSSSKNQIDINIVDSMKNTALTLRKRIQIDNEQIYLLNTYVLVKANSLEQVVSKTRHLINKLYSNGIIGKVANFRQKDAYLATLPCMMHSEDLRKYSHSIFTESGIGKLFPFYSNDIFSENGIIVGKANDKLCAIDMFSHKSNNYNMCIFGTSGAGKSYFVKLMILKNAYKGIRQIIIDPEGEYVNLVSQLGGKIYNIDNYNPFEIEESCLENEDIFNNKMEQIMEYLENRFGIHNKEKIREAVIKTYEDFGITWDRSSLYKEKEGDIFYPKPKYITKFPTLYDLKNNIKEMTNYVSDEQQIYNENNYTNLYCFHIKSSLKEKICDEIKVFLPKVHELITNKTLIYFDEVWKGISNEDRYVIESLYNMFKTLRKKKAGIVAISQDICDLFNLDNGNFGKSILNNSNFKMFFKMEWKDLDVLEKMIIKNEKIDKIRALTRGQAFVCFGNNSFNLEIKATDYEHHLIEGGNYEKNISSNE